MGRPSSARSVGVVARGNGGWVVPSTLEAFTGGPHRVALQTRAAVADGTRFHLLLGDPPGPLHLQ
jgi:hypothetical protein